MSAICEKFGKTTRMKEFVEEFIDLKFSTEVSTSHNFEKLQSSFQRLPEKM